MAYIRPQTAHFGAEMKRLRAKRQKRKSSRELPLELFILVPRDRIELPTRGFSDQIFENPKMA
jgi:hypothetical protein